MGGRTSRRDAGEIKSAEVIKSELFPTAIYARLSDKNSGKDDDGAAIDNQIEVCREYIAENTDLELVKVYMDNGWTGTNMNRPAFEELMDAVRKGEIRAIVVRDISRLARNYLETGIYLEKIFPRLGVRFISVKENLDTATAEDNGDTLLIKLQSLINDLYSKDISRKIHAVYKVQKEEKSFSWRCIPYGYMWNEEHTKIIPEEETAAVVKKIFEWRLEGKGYCKIADMLNEMGVPTARARKKGEDRIWIAATVRDMVKNPAYIGNRVWGRKRKELYKGIKIEHTPESEWIVVENDHEAIISKEVFERVQEMRQEGRANYRAALERNAEARSICVDKLKGKVFCGDCGNRLYYRVMIRNKDGLPVCKGGEYYCRAMNRRMQCIRHSISQKRLEKIILSAIQTQMKIAVNYDGRLKEFRKDPVGKNIETGFKNRIIEAKRKLRSVQAKRQKLYESYADGMMNAEEYALAKESYEVENEKANTNLSNAISEYQNYWELFSSKNKWISMIKGIRNTEELTQEIADMAVEKVLLYKSKAVEVVLKYQDIFEQTEQYLNSVKKGRKK